MHVYDDKSIHIVVMYCAGQGVGLVLVSRRYVDILTCVFFSQSLSAIEVQQGLEYACAACWYTMS